MKVNILSNNIEPLKQVIGSAIKLEGKNKKLHLQDTINAETDLELLAHVLLNDAEVQSQLPVNSTIIIPEFRGDHAPQKSETELLNFICTLAKNGFFNNHRINTSYFSKITEREIDLLEILTSKEIRQSNYIKTITTIESELIKSFYKNLAFQNPDEPFATVEQLMDITKTELEETYQISLSSLHCLRTLSKFDWSKLSENYNGLQQYLIDSLRAKLIHSESYHLEQEPGLHYYMTKITEKNSHSWREFISEQQLVDSATGRKFYGGLVAFIPSLNFFDWSKTNVWVGFISNQVLSHPDEINKESIEMFVTMLTSENSFFTSHSGISRCLTYNGHIHKNISTSLHSFIGSVTQKHYLDQKKYMITCPIIEMTEILIKSFEERNLSSSIYVGFEEINALGPWSRSYHKSAKKLKAVVDAQNIKVSKGEITPLINLEFSTKNLRIPDFDNTDRDDNSNKCSFFTVYDKGGEVVQLITAEDMRGEYVWFFQHRYLYEGQNFSEALLTADIGDLSALLPIAQEQIEYEYHVEPMGESHIY